MPNIFLVSLSILTVKFSNRCCLWRRHTFGLKKIFTLQGVRNERNCHVKWLLKVTAWEKLLFPHSGLQLNKTLLFLNVSLKNVKKKKSSGTFLLWIRTLMFVFFVYRFLISQTFQEDVHSFLCKAIQPLLSPMSLSEATTSVSSLPSTCKLMAPVLLKGQKKKKKDALCRRNLMWWTRCSPLITLAAF